MVCIYIFQSNHVKYCIALILCSTAGSEGENIDGAYPRKSDSSQSEGQYILDNYWYVLFLIYNE